MPSFIRKISMKLDFLKIMVRKTFPFSLLPFTVSISTIGTSGLASTKELKSLTVLVFKPGKNSFRSALPVYNLFREVNISDLKYILINVIIQGSFGYTKFISMRLTNVI